MKQDAEPGVASVCTPDIPALGRRRQENSQVKAHLDDILGPWCKTPCTHLQQHSYQTSRALSVLGPKCFLASWPQSELSRNMGVVPMGTHTHRHTHTLPRKPARMGSLTSSVNTHPCSHRPSGDEQCCQVTPCCTAPLLPNLGPAPSQHWAILPGSLTDTVLTWANTRPQNCNSASILSFLH